MTSIKKYTAAALAGAILATALIVPTAAETPAESIRISSYKGNTLEVGERSGLIIGPSGTRYTVTSSNSDIIAVESTLLWLIYSIHAVTKFFEPFPSTKLTILSAISCLIFQSFTKSLSFKKICATKSELIRISLAQGINPAF